MPDWLRFVLAAFACFRLAELIAVDEGPGDVLLMLRAKLGACDLDDDGQPKTSIGRMIICPWCWGIYIAAGLALMISPWGYEILLWWLAIAGGQAFLQRVGGRV